MLLAVLKLSAYTNVQNLTLIHFLLAYPYIQYGIPTWGGACQTTLQPLLVKQKLIVKCMLHQSYRTSSSPLFSQLGLLKINEVYKFQIGKLLFNQIRKNNNIIQNLTSLSDLHAYNTRSVNNQNLYIPSVNSNLGKTSLTYHGAIIWNSIPTEIRNSSIYNFKFLLRKYFLKNYLR